MATGIKIADFIRRMANKTFDLSTDSVNIALSNTAPASETNNPTASNNGLLTNVTQISYTNYADSLTVDRKLESVTSTESGGTWTLNAASFTVTPAGGALASFRYVYLYDSTAAGNPLIALWDIGFVLALASGQPAQFTISGLVTVA